MTPAFHQFVFCFLMAFHLYEGAKTGSKKCQPKNEDSGYSAIHENETNIEIAIQFMDVTDREDTKLFHYSTLKNYEYNTNLTDINKKKADKADMMYQNFIVASSIMGKRFDWASFKEKNATLYRWFKLFLELPATDDNSHMPKQYMRATESTNKSMAEIFNEARVCPKNEKDKKRCNLSFIPDLMEIFSKSRDLDELKSLWTQFRDETGKKMRSQFLEQVDEQNSIAKSKGFNDYGVYMTQPYECKNFKIAMKESMQEILPLYKQFHAYVRRKLKKYYKDKIYIADNGPIPAHLLGDVYGQKWTNTFEIINPFPNKRTPNITESLKKLRLTVLDMFIMAEKFFVSIGLERMTPHFWAKSMIEKPNDREVVCSGAAYDMFDGKDFRIKMCTTVNSDQLAIVHHEMGHIEYDMLYKHHPKPFRRGANSGFHEAVGEVITLSSSTLEYLKQSGLVSEEFDEDEETDISYLIKMALSYLPTIPYAYIIDTYRYAVYDGTIREAELNKMWWQLKLDYQGLCPPVKRTEKDFDPGAKFHVANGVEYMRYFFANIFAFQIHKAVCNAAEHKGPLFKCNIYGNAKAGKLLRKVLSLGNSKPWQEVMLILTGGTTSQLEVKPFLEYFKPLSDWLKKKISKDEVGWMNTNPMRCPTDRKV